MPGVETLFMDPPTGRLPSGTRTSVYLHTDCGYRWVDLGVIPVRPEQPSLRETLALTSVCAAKSNSWNGGVKGYKWLPYAQT
jgi:hypothetical protein